MQKTIQEYNYNDFVDEILESYCDKSDCLIKLCCERLFADVSSCDTNPNNEYCVEYGDHCDFEAHMEHEFMSYKIKNDVLIDIESNH